MRTRHILLALAGASVIAGGQALAQGRGGGHGGGHGMGAGVGARGGIDVGRGGIDLGGRAIGRIDRDDIRTVTRVGFDRRTDARINSQGSANASARARARANPNSAIHDPDALIDLTDLATGQVVLNADGEVIGTIVRINRSSDGRISNVLVRGDGRTIPIFPNTITGINTTDDEVETTLVLDVD